MAVGGKDESKQYLKHQKMNVCHHGSLVVFIRSDSAEIWGFRYGPTPVIGTKKKKGQHGYF
jgi:hypothetical protein